MLASPATLRRLAEQHNYTAIRDLLCETRAGTPDERVLEALAAAHLGHARYARDILASLDLRALDLDVRVDLAAVRIALGDLEAADCILQCARLDILAGAEVGAGIESLLLARLAWCALQQGRREDAIDFYRQSIDRRPHLAAYQKLLRLHLEDDHLEDMTSCLAEAQRFWSSERLDWPEAQRGHHDHHLREMQLALWLARGEIDQADDWLSQQRETLSEDDWCRLAVALALHLAAGDRHDAAEESLRRALRHYPSSPELHRQAAEFSFLQGRIRQGIRLIRRAIDAAERRDMPVVPLWLRLSAALLPVNPVLARTAADRANEALSAPGDSNGPDDVEAWRAQHAVLLADLDAQEGRYDTAEARYRSIIEKQSDQVQALQGLARLATHLGRFNESEALFERLRRIDPSLGHGDLLNLGRIPDDRDALSRMENIARTPAMEGSVRPGLLFQLATAWEKHGDYRKAFDLAREANSISRHFLNYEPEAHRHRCARIRHAFPAELFRERAGSGLRTTVPVFIVGMPRSGTTLVEQIVAGHSRIHGAGELGTIPGVIAGLERWERRTGSGRHYPDCVDDLDPGVVHGIAANVLEELRTYAPEADHIVDKLPHNFEHVGLIKLLFPDARIISVRRDPRDIAISNYFTDYAGKHGGMGFAYDLDWIGEQLADHNLLMHHWQALFPADILEVHYEDLLADPQTAARQLLNHIGVDWEPEVLAFHTLDRPVKTASVWQVRQPLYQSSRGRWRHYERHLGPLIDATNRKIEWQPIEMVTLPVPGWLNTGVDLYQSGDLDAAELRFRQLLHHLPEHAAARYMLGIVCLNKGQFAEGIAMLTRALESCPWNRLWRDDLAKAHRLTGDEQAAAALFDKLPDGAPAARNRNSQNPPLDYLYLSEEDA